MKRSLFIFGTLGLLCICLFLAAGCLREPETGKEPVTPPATPATTGPVFGPEDNGKNATVAAGTVFSLRLPENPTTGYIWNMTTPEGLSIVRNEFIAPDTRLVGAGGIHEWIFRAEEKGTYPLHAEYRRPWLPSGTIVFLPLEGGFFGISGDDGTKYLPLNLGEEFRVDGLRVVFEAEEARDTATIQMWGTPVNLTFIEATETYDLHVTAT